jgi:hypothetical protein
MFHKRFKTCLDGKWNLASQQILVAVFVPSPVISGGKWLGVLTKLNSLEQCPI